ncbi:MAG: hypothetical protein ACOY3P_26375 [Planctomycetota bacterium]
MLCWALPPDVDGRRLLRSGTKHRRASAQVAEDMQNRLAEVFAGLFRCEPGAQAHRQLLVEALAACYVAMDAGQQFPHESASRLLAALEAAVAGDPEEFPLEYQWQAGEIKIALAALLADSKLAKRLAREGQKATARGMLELIDGRGIPHADDLPLLRPLLASWTRCLAIADRTGSPWPAGMQSRYRKAVRGVLHLTRPDGGAVFGGGRADEDRALLATALHLSGEDMDQRVARTALRGISVASSRNGAVLPELPKPAVESEAAATAVLRAAWSRRAPRIVVTYPGRHCDIELCVDEKVLLSGRWGFEVARDGKPLATEGDWEQTCWVSDKEVDYLELQIALSGGARLQRHVMLSRADDTALLADAVLTSPSDPSLLSLAPAAGLQYRGTWQLACNERSTVRFQPQADSREGYLVAGVRRALVMPLALPEWREDRRVGELEAGATEVSLRHEAAGENLFAPLWLDLNPRHLRAQRTWRQLSVGEGLQAVPLSVAAGFRIAVDKKQWILYRALSRRGNRTLLGHNLSSEMLVARFDRRGEVHSLIEIE